MARARGGGPRYLRARAEALPCATASFDTVVVCLALEHVDAFETAIDEVARVLEPGGRFVLLLCHPLLQAPGSAWIDDRILDEMYWRVGAYLDERRGFHEVAPGVELLFVHRPLSRYIHAMGRGRPAGRRHVRGVAARAVPRGHVGLPRSRHHPPRAARARHPFPLIGQSAARASPAPAATMPISRLIAALRNDSRRAPSSSRRTVSKVQVLKVV